MGRALQIGTVAALVAATACGSAHSSAGHGASSCVGPYLRSDERHTPPDHGHPTTLGTVRPGRQITVYGRQYYSGRCNDTDPTAVRTASGGLVPLTLTTADHHQVRLGVARPRGRDGSFVAVLVVPARAAPGPATVDDGQGDTVVLDVAAG